MDKISHLYNDYNDIVAEFGEKVIRDRFSDLYKEYEFFLKARNCDNRVRISDFALMHAVLDYFTDISRLKRFHEISYTNLYKTKAYEMCWLLRRKPLQVMVDEMDDELVYINEKFIMSHIMMYFVSLVGNDFYENLSEDNKRSFDGYIDSVYYHLKYRNCGAQTLELFLLSFGAGLTASNYKLSNMFINDKTK